MMKQSLWAHCTLTAYLWIISAIPLGNWNRQPSELLLPALLRGHGLAPADLGMLLFISLPAILFWIAYRRSSLWFGIGALGFDLVWLAMQVQTWWIPYLFGAHGWRLDYAKGPTTKLLPSFGAHVAPDGMHLLISLLLIAALWTGTLALIALFRISPAEPCRI
jgi:hypothetical protein